MKTGLPLIDETIHMRLTSLKLESVKDLLRRTRDFRLSIGKLLPNFAAQPGSGLFTRHAPFKVATRTW